MRRSSHRPRPAPDPWTRPVSSHVSSTSTTPFATIVAPAGYGKSTLLSRWANLDPRPFAWVQVDERDDDSIVFLRSIAAAVDRVHPIAAAQIEALVGPGESIWSRVPFIGNAIAALTTPLVLAIDDIHAITNSECLNVLASLFAYVPPGSSSPVEPSRRCRSLAGARKGCWKRSTPRNSTGRSGGGHAAARC